MEQHKLLVEGDIHTRNIKESSVLKLQTVLEESSRILSEITSFPV